MRIQVCAAVEIEHQLAGGALARVELHARLVAERAVVGHEQAALVQVIDGEHLHLRAGENHLLHRTAAGSDAIDGMRRRHALLHGGAAPFALEFLERGKGGGGGGIRVRSGDGGRGESESEEGFHGAPRVLERACFASSRKSARGRF